MTSSLSRLALDFLFPRSVAAGRSRLTAYAPAISCAFCIWLALLHLLDRPLKRWSSWYRSLSIGDQRFVRAYILRSIWALQGVSTSLCVLRDPRRWFQAERLDPISGWSRINDYLYPLTLGFALLENYVELRYQFWPFAKQRFLMSYLCKRGLKGSCEVDEEEVDIHLSRSTSASSFKTNLSSSSSSIDSLSTLCEDPPLNLIEPVANRCASGDIVMHQLSGQRTRHLHRQTSGTEDETILNESLPSTTDAALASSRKPVTFNPSLLIHHLLFLMVEVHTFRSQSLVYFCNILKLWEGTAPVSFLVWLTQRRMKPAVTEPHQPRSSGLSTLRRLRWLILLRLVVWILLRSVFDVFFMRLLWKQGLFPGGRRAGLLNAGNKLQLWLAGPLFWFGLNPFWLYGAVKSLLRIQAEIQAAKRLSGSVRKGSQFGATAMRIKGSKAVE